MQYSSAPNATTRSTSPSAIWAGRPTLGRGRHGRSHRRRCPRPSPRAGPRRRPADRLPAGGQSPLRRLRSAAECIEVAHGHGAWVHVDGAFGLWAASSPALAAPCRRARPGRLLGHRRPQDPERPLRLRHGHRRRPTAPALDPRGPRQLSDPGRAGRRPRRSVREGARVLAPGSRSAGVGGARSLGRSGVAALVEGLTTRARELARGPRGHRRRRDPEPCRVHAGVRGLPGRRDDPGGDSRTIADGTVWMSGSRWHGRAVLRISVSNWSTDEDDVRRSVEAVRRAVAAVRG